MHAYQYDVIVIGSGPGGEGAAMKLTKSGKQIAVVEEKAQVGGNCTHRTTIPSKALRQAIQQMLDSGTYADANYQHLLRSAESVIAQQVHLRSGFYERNLVEVIHGRAAFVDAHTIEVTAPSGATKRYTAGHFIIATGARPYHPDDIDFTNTHIQDSDTILTYNQNPRSITIYGAGVIGCEYASIFRGLRIKVNLIDPRDRLLSFLDDEIIDALSYHLRDNGVLIRHNEEYARVEAHNDGVTLYLKSNKVIHSDLLLWAQGRTGNADHMGLEPLGIAINQRGSIEVNADYQSAQPHIYAVGDVAASGPSLASAAYDQGRFAATHIVTGQTEYQLVEQIPSGIYTIPEISSIGATERELTEERVPYEVGHAFFRHLARAQLSGRTTGMLKILFHRETLQILGIHCFGSQATEIIHIGQAIMAQQDGANTLMYFVNTTFNYPTMAEAYRVAALNGLNRVQ
ncbi:MAG: Si-specific NAD(P)(+) transhydrogenase [Caldilineaceae bacterium]|nr:Si-specific NAD(P)(+) transhydrogenase [Caldilineaceae bacterium]